MSKFLSIEGTRGQIFVKLDVIFNKKDKLLRSKSGYKYHVNQLLDASGNKCNICIVHLPNGFLIETEYPDQDNAYERVWVCEPYLGRVTYIEISNPDLKSKYKHYGVVLSKAESLELHALPKDLDFVNNLLDHAVKSLNDITYKKQSVLKIEDFKYIDNIG